MRLVVDPEHRGRGIGRALARRAVLEAVELGLAKLVVEVIADQAALIGMFRALGFEPEALLADHVRDRSGEVRDLMVLANAVECAVRGDGRRRHHGPAVRRLSDLAGVTPELSSGKLGVDPEQTGS